MRDFDTSPSACPFCRAVHDAAAVVEGIGDPNEHPQAGDFTLCFECGRWLVFADDKLRLRKPTAPESDEIARDAQFRRVRAAWLEFRNRQGRKRQ